MSVNCYRLVLPGNASKLPLSYNLKYKKIIISKILEIKQFFKRTWAVSSVFELDGILSLNFVEEWLKTRSVVGWGGCYASVNVGILNLKKIVKHIFQD